MRSCKKCNTPLTADEVGLSLKLVNRNSAELLCVNCLSEHFKLPPSDLLAMADRFRKTGCVLFQKKD